MYITHSISARFINARGYPSTGVDEMVKNIMNTKVALKQVKCKRCNKVIKSYSPMRKWCTDCRKIIALEQLKMRKMV